MQIRKAAQFSSVNIVVRVKAFGSGFFSWIRGSFFKEHFVWQCLSEDQSMLYVLYSVLSLCCNYYAMLLTSDVSIIMQNYLVFL